MIPNNRVGPLIVQNQTISDVLQFSGSSKLGAIGAAVQHESGGLTGDSAISSEIGRDASGTNLSRIIQSYFNGYSAEEIVQEHSVTNVTPGRLEEKMNMLNLRISRHYSRVRVFDAEV